MTSTNRREPSSSRSPQRMQTNPQSIVTPLNPPSRVEFARKASGATQTSTPAMAANWGMRTSRSAARQVTRAARTREQGWRQIEGRRAVPEEREHPRDCIRLNSTVGLAPVEGGEVPVKDGIRHEPDDGLIRARRGVEEIPRPHECSGDDRHRNGDDKEQASRPTDARAHFDCGLCLSRDRWHDQAGLSDHGAHRPMANGTAGELPRTVHRRRDGDRFLLGFSGRSITLGGHGRRAGRLANGMRPPPVPPSTSTRRSAHDHLAAGVVEHDPPVAPELVRAQQALGARQADGAEVGRSDQLLVERQTRHRPGPAVHERHRDDRADGGLTLGQVGALRVPKLRATEEDTTLCDEPVSTTNSRREPPAKRAATLSDTSPVAGVTVSGTVVPLSPSVSAEGTAPCGPVNGDDWARGAPSGPGRTSAPAAKSTRTLRSGTGRRSRAGRRAHPSRPSGAAWRR